MAYPDKTSDYLTIDDFDGIQVILLERVLKKYISSFLFLLFFFCLYISQPQNVLNLLFFDQFQPRCCYKVRSYKKKL